MARIPVRVVVDNHVHAGRRCAPGDVIHLRPDQVRWMGTRVQRADRPELHVRATARVAVPPAPEHSGDDAAGDDDSPPDDPEPEPEPDHPRPAGGAEKHRQQGASSEDAHPTALTLPPFREGAA